MQRSTILWFLLAAVVACAPGDARGEGLHDPLDRILERYVDAEGRVAYRDLERDARQDLARYLAALETVDVDTLERSQAIAFWLNAYNAHVLQGVLEGLNAEGFLARKRFFSWHEFRVAGAERTLQQIEHEILRKRYAEPRIHFALVCASTSCPKLRREAYRGARLDEQLDAQAKEFLGDRSRNRIGPDNPLRLSKIFDWFAADFTATAGSVPAYVARYREIPDDPKIEYLEYDWTMNAQPGQRP